jgi:hypothetical protein
LAHGVDIVGQSEDSEPAVFGSISTATVARAMLSLPDRPSTADAALLDMTGRHVGDLHSGANNFSGLAPGVYFVREAQVRAVRKIVITR